MKILIQVKLSPVLASQWDGTAFLRTLKKLLCFFEECRKRWNNIAWKQIAGRDYETIQSKDGEAEVDNVEEIHG